MMHMIKNEKNIDINGKTYSLSMMRQIIYVYISFQQMKVQCQSMWMSYSDEK